MNKIVRKQKIGYRLSDYNYSQYSSSSDAITKIVDSIKKRDNALIKNLSDTEAKEVRIQSIYDTDYDDIRCIAILMEKGREIANVRASYESKEFEFLLNNKFNYESEIVINHFKTLILDEFSLHNSLPKISKCSKLLQNIYDNVCWSDSCMYHVDKDDWENLYADDYTNKDIENLKSEIKELGLEEVVGINDLGYVIVGYGDLETRFNDDRNLQKYVIKNMEIENSGGYVMVYYGELESGEWYLHSDLNDNINIYNAKPFEEDYYLDEYNWHNNHLISEIKNQDAKEMFKKMDSFIDKIAIEPNWNKTFHQHFQNMINMENKKGEYEYRN